MIRILLRRAACALLVGALFCGPAAAAPRNVIIFVADGLRSRMVTPQTAPAFAALRSEGVDFANSHSRYPTLTTVNASAIATGHQIGDTGDFGNTIFAGAAFPAPYASPLVNLEDDAVLGLLNARFSGDYLGHPTLLQAARAKGFTTAAIGKVGPTAIQDVTIRDGAAIVIDDNTNRPGAHGVGLSPGLGEAIAAAGLPASSPENPVELSPGTFQVPGTKLTNAREQDWFVAVATRVLLPRFKAQGRPFVMVFWSCDPDCTQHAQGDSLNTLTPGINGPTSLAAIRNASDDLQALRDALKAQGLDADTDIIVTADHGFSTASKQSATSAAAAHRYPDVTPGLLPRGFVGIDLAKDLGLPLFDGKGVAVRPEAGGYPKGGVLLGADPAHPAIAIAPNSGTDLIYLPGPDARALAPRIVEALTRQDYTGAIFVNDALGPIAGALPMSRAGLIGDARTPQPAIVVAFRSFSTGCADPELCGAAVTDSGVQQGQGTHGSFGRQDTHNFMAAAGPDFRRGFVDPAPVGNADWAVTLAHVLGLDLGAKGPGTGRVMSEALRRGGPAPRTRRRSVRSAPAANGFVTVLNYQEAAGRTYFDAAGMPGRTLGLRP